MTDFIFDKEVSFVIAGEAGQGIDTITQIIAETIKKNDFNVFYTKEYMSRIKGGCNSSTVRVCANKVYACKERVDFAFAISKDALNHLKNRFLENSIIFYEYENKEVTETFKNSVQISFTEMSREFGSNIYINAIVAGIISGILNIDSNLLSESFKKILSNKPQDIIEKNINAIMRGYEFGKNFVNEKNIGINIAKDSTTKNEILISGTDSAALGCISGGADFISSYPMSPATDLLIFMARHCEKFNILVEQAEDEISAINMGLGAWYAGARAMVGTAGGGFALMCEGLSLSGMTEIPMVIYLGQRPAPSTGLPTRTEQGGLNLALYAGHGDFPRIILTPGTLEDCFYLSQKAFNLADKFQIPVFILTDQYLADSCYNIPQFNFDNFEITEYITKTNTDYKRYKLTQDGISPRGIPGYGEGLVVIDSDEHDEEGHITEDLDLRIKMVDKRMKKNDSIKPEFINPEFYGSTNSKTLIVGWGSTCNIINEALSKINNPDIGFLYFKQVYPLNDSVLEYFKNKEKIICIENNYSGQFANLLKLELNISVNEKILKYNGMPFFVEELVSRINEAIK